MAVGLLQRSRFVYKVLRVVFYIALAFFVGCGFILIFQILSYVVGLCFNVDGDTEAECIRNYSKRRSPDPSGFIPLHIHQIYFSVNNKSVPKVWEFAQETWQDDNPGCTYTFWDADKFRAFLRAKYPDLESLYNNYDHWISRVDVARLIILHYYGGVYIDMDVRSRKPLTPLFYILSRRYEAVLYRTLPLGVASDLIMSKTGSQFLAHALCGLKAAQRRYLLPYLTEMLAAGPLYIYLRYLTYGRQSDVKVLESHVISRFVRHIDGRTWHQWDGVLFWWIFYKRYLLMKVFAVLLCASIFYIIIFRRKFGKPKLCNRIRICCHI